MKGNMDTQHLPKFKKISLACIPGHSLMRNGMATYNPTTQRSIFLSRKHRPFRLKEKSSEQVKGGSESAVVY